MKEIKQIRKLLLFFIISIAISGLTAIPVKQELIVLTQLLSKDSSLHFWLTKVLVGYTGTFEQYPFLMYGYDWLAFAHVILAILFIGPYKDPCKNIWVIEFGMISCLLVLPVAFIAGHLRGLPFWWQLIDCSFGVVGLIVLSTVYSKIKKLNPAS